MIHIGQHISVPEHAPVCRELLADDHLGIRAAWALAVENPASPKVIARIWRMQLEAAKPKQGRLL